MAFRENIFISVHIKITRNVSLLDHKMTTGSSFNWTQRITKEDRVGRGICWGQDWVAEEGNRDEYD